MNRHAALWLGLYVCLVSPADARRVLLDKPLIQIGDQDLGGIRTIIQYEFAAPDRTDIAILFLTAPARPGILPMEVQVLDGNGSEQYLIDSEGADCTLKHVEVFRAGSDVAVIVATRISDAASFSQADPGPMVIQIYQLEADNDAGRSPIVLKALGKPAGTKPLCAREDVERAIDSVASGWRRMAAEH